MSRDERNLGWWRAGSGTIVVYACAAWTQLISRASWWPWGQAEYM